MLMWGGIAALVLIVAAVIFGLSLGIWFSVAMIALAGGSILYQTQQIMARYPSNAHVGAAVQLFASVMMLFWYVLRLLSQMRQIGRAHSELQSLMRISYAVFCLTKQK